jgi:hypothetical protein
LLSAEWCLRVVRRISRTSFSVGTRAGGGGGFLTYFHSPWGCDEPEILRTSNHQIGPIGADAGHVTGPKQRVGPLDKPKTLR